MSTQLISTINNQRIEIVIDEKGQKFVPIKPICEAIGVSIQSQIEKLESDDIISSVIRLCLTTGADGKEYKMKCIPLKYVLGWVFGISLKSVKEEIRGPLKLYKEKCYDVLFDYFTEHATYIEEKERILNDYVDKEIEARNHFKNAEKLLREIRTERDIFRKTTFNDWKEKQTSMTDIDGFLR